MSSALPDSRGLNLFTADPGFEALLELYLPGELHAHLRPHLVARKRRFHETVARAVPDCSPWIEMFRNARRWVE